LGIYHKLITGPLWKLLESKTHILDMDKHYSNLYEKVKIWADDPYELLDGSAVLFVSHPPEKDEVLISSFTDSTENINSLTREILVLLCLSTIMVCECMLVDHLPGGKYHNIDSLEMRTQTQSVPKTSVRTEHDFGSLDRLLREKPNASTVALEGLILFANNKKGPWLRSLHKTYRTGSQKIRRLC
jgi:hypothetical protein